MVAEELVAVEELEPVDVTAEELEVAATTVMIPDLVTSLEPPTEVMT